jgi:leucyl aminopeptidase (aminopeptidase T)
LQIPEKYSADVETGTVNGSVNLDFPVMVQGKIGTTLRFTLGDGGAPVRVKTVNGGVRLERP